MLLRYSPGSLARMSNEFDSIPSGDVPVPAPPPRRGSNLVRRISVVVTASASALATGLVTGDPVSAMQVFVLVLEGLRQVFPPPTR